MFKINAMPQILPSELIDEALKAEPATIGHIQWRGFPDAGVRSLANPRRIAGTLVSLVVPSADSTILHHAISMLRPGDVLVIDRLGDRRYACVGGGIATAVVLAQAAGIIIDGLCTDIDELRQSGLPVWGRGLTAITTRTPGNAGFMNVPVSIGGAVGMPGDLVIADESGIVFLSPSDAAETVAAAIAIQKEEAILLPRLKDTPLGQLTGATEKVERALMP